MVLEVAGPDELVDLLGDGFADGGDLLEPALLLQVGHGEGILLDGLGGSAVRGRPVEGLPLDLQQVRDLAEDLADPSIVHLTKNRFSRPRVEGRDRARRLALRYC